MSRIWLALAAAALFSCTHGVGGGPAPVPGAPAEPAAVGDQPVAYTDTNSAEALRNLRRIGGRDPASLPEAELVEWVRARFAWVALLRLQGKEREALEVFTGCGAWCAKHGPAAEWGALKKWGCRKDPKAGACR